MSSAIPFISKCTIFACNNTAETTRYHSPEWSTRLLFNPPRAINVLRPGDSKPLNGSTPYSNSIANTLASIASIAHVRNGKRRGAITAAFGGTKSASADRGSRMSRERKPCRARKLPTKEFDHIVLLRVSRIQADTTTFEKIDSRLYAFNLWRSASMIG